MKTTIALVPQHLYKGHARRYHPAYKPKYTTTYRLTTETPEETEAHLLTVEGKSVTEIVKWAIPSNGLTNTCHKQPQNLSYVMKVNIKSSLVSARSLKTYAAGVMSVWKRYGSVKNLMLIIMKSTLKVHNPCVIILLIYMYK